MVRFLTRFLNKKKKKKNSQKANKTCFGITNRLIGSHPKPEQFTMYLRSMRRAGALGEFVSIYLDNPRRRVVVGFFVPRANFSKN